MVLLRLLLLTSNMASKRSGTKLVRWIRFSSFLRCSLASVMCYGWTDACLGRYSEPEKGLLHGLSAHIAAQLVLADNFNCVDKMPWKKNFSRSFGAGAVVPNFMIFPPHKNTHTRVCVWSSSYSMSRQIGMLTMLPT